MIDVCSRCAASSSRHQIVASTIKLKFGGCQRIIVIGHIGAQGAVRWWGHRQSRGRVTGGVGGGGSEGGGGSMAEMTAGLRAREEDKNWEVAHSCSLIDLPH
jgi:hypothetical protein